MVPRVDRKQLEQLARLNAWGRIVIGASVIVFPRLLGPGWVGDSEMTNGAKVLARALGARDLALGIGVNAAIDNDAPVRGWLEGSALADVLDATATLLAWRSLPARGRTGVLAIAAGSAVQCALVARSIDS
jgi:hypothetical protein